jgi:hypothetical protein
MTAAARGATILKGTHILIDVCLLTVELYSSGMKDNRFSFCCIVVKLIREDHFVSS